MQEFIKLIKHGIQAQEGYGFKKFSSGYHHNDQSSQASLLKDP